MLLAARSAAPQMLNFLAFSGLSRLLFLSIAGVAFSSYLCIVIQKPEAPSVSPQRGSVVDTLEGDGISTMISLHRKDAGTLREQVEGQNLY